MEGDMAADLTKTQIEDYKKIYNNSRRKSKPKNQKGIYDANPARTNACNVVVITTGPKGSMACVEAEEEFPDDNASICSSQSSGTSENSAGANKRTKKIRRVRCEIHSKKNKKDSSLPEEPEPNESKTLDGKVEQKYDKQATPVCTCSKTRTRRCRPEPEGGLIQGGKGMSSSIVMSELDLILCSNEPLFSDSEEEKETNRNKEEVEDSKLKLTRNLGRRQGGPNGEEMVTKESDRLRGNLSGGGVRAESAFCVQMLNTNTSIKFAILQTELKNIKDRSLKRVEADITSISTRFTNMQELVENCIQSLTSFTQQVQQTSKFISSQIEKERREENELTCSHIDMDAMNVSSKQSFSSCDLDVSNNRMSHLERKITELEGEIKSLGSSNPNETTRLKARLKEVLNDMSVTERSIIHISSCLNLR